MTGRIEAIYLTPHKGLAPAKVARARALAGKGLDGDRYALGEGTFSALPGNGRHLTLIDSSVVQTLGISNGESRRNIETWGVDLRDLVGQFFMLGKVLAYGARPCEPCKHLCDLLGRPELIQALASNDGLRADILSSAELEAGAPVTVLGQELRVYLDDERPTPKGWFGVRWPDQAIEVLMSGSVSEISLDHDLGDDGRGTGYDVILWLEREVFERRFAAPRIQVHSANVSARAKMEAGIKAITERQFGES